MINDRIHTVLTEIAQPMEALSIGFVEEHSLWIMIFDEELPVFLAATGRDNHWVMSGPICDPPEVGRQQFTDLLMIYNGQPELSGGFRIGLDEPEGMLKLSIDLSSSDFEPAGLKTMIEELRMCRRTWELLADNWQPGAAQDASGQLMVPPGKIA